MNNYIPPSEYYTFDAIKNDPIEVVEAVLASKSGDHTEIKKLSEEVSEIDELQEGEPSTIDAATMLFLACICLLYTSPSPRDATLSRMPSSA